MLIFQVICASDESEDEVSGPVHRRNDDSADKILDSDSEDVGDSDNEQVTDDDGESDGESGSQNDGSGYLVSEDGEESNDESVLVQRKKVGVLKIPCVRC